MEPLLCKNELKHPKLFSRKAILLVVELGHCVFYHPKLHHSTESQ